MKNLLLLICIFALGGCWTVHVHERDGGLRVLEYQHSAPEFATSNNQLNSFSINVLAKKAQQVCPQGYEKVKEYQKISPPDGSRAIWEVRCLK